MSSHSLQQSIKDIGNSELVFQLDALDELRHRLSDKAKLLVAKAESWIREFVAKPNTDLGRKGDVCPFVRTSISKFNGIYLGLWEEDKVNLSSLVSYIRELIKIFPTLLPNGVESKDFKAIAVVFSDTSEVRAALDQVHQHLKPEVISKGMMIGQFYGQSHYPGLHSESFRPFNSPSPLLVLRYMQVIDLPFLCRAQIEVNSYCRKFQVQSVAELNAKVKRMGIDTLPDSWDESVTSLFKRGKE
jgi:hypothetical protein